MTWFWILYCAIAFVLAVLCAGVLIPQILLISFRKSLFDEPDARKIHTSAVPRLGGLAFMPVVCFTFVVLFGIGLYVHGKLFLMSILPTIRTYCFVSCGLMLLYIVGMADDLVGVRYKAKFVVQILAAVTMILGGVWFLNFYGIFWIYAVPEWLGWPFTVVVTVFLINAINLIDGIDGLASGLCSIAVLTYGVVYFWAEEYMYATLSFATLGVLVPFFYYNVFGSAKQQKKIFMGDTGSLTIGMMIAFLSLRLLRMPMPEELEGVNMLVLAFSPLIIPCFDVVRVYGERLAQHKSPFLPDKRHIHHKLLALGWKQRRAMISLLVCSVVVTLVNVWLSTWININLLLVIDAAAWVGAILLINKKIHAYREAHPEKAQPQAPLPAVVEEAATPQLIDADAVVDYVDSQEGDVDVMDIPAFQKVEKMRVYTLINELRKQKRLKVTTTEYISVPKTVRNCKKK